MRVTKEVASPGQVGDIAALSDLNFSHTFGTRMLTLIVVNIYCYKFVPINMPL